MSTRLFHRRCSYQFSTVAKAMAGCTAVICATGPTDRLNPLGPFTVDSEGTKNLVAAAQQAGVRKFVLVTSIGCDDPLFPLNLYWVRLGAAGAWPACAARSCGGRLLPLPQPQPPRTCLLPR